MRRRWLTGLVAATVLIGGLAGCGGGDDRFGVHEDAIGVSGEEGFPDDVPLPEGAEIVVAIAPVYTFYVPGSVDEVREFYEGSDLPGLAFEEEDLTAEEEEVADDVIGEFANATFDGGDFQVFPAETEAGDSVTQINFSVEG